VVSTWSVRWLGLITLVASSPLRAQPGATVALTVRAHGFRGAAGQALVMLYGSPSSWLKADRALRRVQLPIVDGAIETRFAELPRGSYAVTVIHDENGNGRLDMRWLPWPRPREGTGVSNGAKGGPPRWRDAKRDLDADERIDVTVNY
jgi:uncharacterized protein (DUF2141 family)